MSIFCSPFACMKTSVLAQTISPTGHAPSNQMLLLPDNYPARRSQGVSISVSVYSKRSPELVIEDIVCS